MTALMWTLKIISQLRDDLFLWEFIPNYNVSSKKIIIQKLRYFYFIFQLNAPVWRPVISEPTLPRQKKTVRIVEDEPSEVMVFSSTDKQEKIIMVIIIIILVIIIIIIVQISDLSFSIGYERLVEESSASERTEV